MIADYSTIQRFHMTVEREYELSCYKKILQLDSNGDVFLSRHIETGRMSVRKNLPLYSKDTYDLLDSYTTTHPELHIPAIIDMFSDDENLYVIEEYIEGKTLLQIMDEQTMTDDEVALLGTKLCTILSGLHSLTPPIIHRDIKPSNLIIDTHGELYLIDFDSAKLYAEGNNEDTVLLGTRGYAAPEQYGFGQSSPQTDIYGVGALMLALLTGSERDKNEYHGKLASIIEKCMRLDPSDRYSDATELKNALLPFVKNATNYDNDSLTNKKNAPKKQSVFSRSLYHIPYLPVGFRTGTIKNMIAAVLSYSIIFSILTSGVLTENAKTAAERTFFTVYWVILIVLTIGYWGDYLGIRQKLVPAKRRGIRVLLSILIYVAIIILTLVIAVFPYSTIE